MVKRLHTTCDKDEGRGRTVEEARTIVAQEFFEVREEIGGVGAEIPGEAVGAPLALADLEFHSGEGELPVPFDGRKVRVRCLGISTPKTMHPEKGVAPFGPEADAANRRLVAGKTVRLELDVELWDRYQRLLAYVYVGDLIGVSANRLHGFERVILQNIRKG